MRAFLAKSTTNEVFATTSSVGDCEFMPAGFTFYECVGAQHDFIGVRMPVLSGSDLPLLRPLSEYLLKIGSPNDPLNRACDTLTQAE